MLQAQEHPLPPLRFQESYNYVVTPAMDHSFSARSGQNQLQRGNQLQNLIKNCV